MPTATVTTTSSLGPQCAKCRKRRVKCDSATPHCHRCQRDNFECPGYADRRSTWTIATPSSINSALKLRAKASSRRPTSPVTSTALQSVPTPSSFASSISTPLSPFLTQPDDLMCHQFNDALAYWTSTIQPLLPCSPLTGPVRGMSQQEWTSLPRIMLHTIVSTLASVRLARCAGHGTQHSDVVTRLRTHRGRALELLRGYLAELQDMRSKGVQEPLLGWSALVLITAVMTNEFSIASTGAAWGIHLEAAWTLVGLQGGFPRRTDKTPDIEKVATFDPVWSCGFETARTCIWVLQLEVFSATTCPMWALERRAGVREALQDDVLENLEDELLRTICPCPLAVFRALAETNELRLDLYASSKQAEQAADPVDGVTNDLSKRLWDTLTSLICFDAAAWADKLYERHPPDPPPSQTDDPSSYRAMWHLSWTTLANCYRSAAVLYLIHAVQPAHLQTPALPSACAAFMQHDANTSLLAAHRHALAGGLAFLMRDYEADTGAPASLGDKGHGHESVPCTTTMPNLWRYLSWPLFVDAYEAVAWGDDEEPQHDTPAAKTVRLARMGRVLGATCLIDAAALLDAVCARRIEGRVWRWGDAFEQRCIFAV